jgi:DNA repair protein RecO (recombination protein O)
VNLDSCDLLHSQFALVSNYSAGVSLDYFAEISEQLLPASEPNEKYFRLLLTVLEHMRSGGAVWNAVTYFSLWAVRLAGMLPELHACLSCGAWLEDPEGPEKSFFSRGHNGLVCAHCRNALDLRNTWELSSASRALAEQILHRPISQLSAIAWQQETAADLRRFLVQQIEAHIDRKLITVATLEAA